MSGPIGGDVGAGKSALAESFGCDLATHLKLPVSLYRLKLSARGSGLDAGALDDKAPGGHPLHGLLAEEIAEIVALYHEWGDIDRSHRKLAHRGSYLGRVWVSPASVRRVLAAQGLALNPPPRPGSSVRKPFPDWVEYRPNQIWIYDTTHFTRSKSPVTIVEDLVSRKWIADIVSSEETSTQVEIVFTDALEAEGLLALVEVRADEVIDPGIDDDRLPILLAVSDNGSQMTSISTRKSLCRRPQGSTDWRSLGSHRSSSRRCRGWQSGQPLAASHETAARTTDSASSMAAAASSGGTATSE